MREVNIRYQVMWDRLTTIVEEQARTLIRTGFSVSTREAGDVSAGVFDLQGRMLAQAVTGTPGHINSMALSVGHFIEKFPIKKMKEGEVFLTNDPWKGTGHLHDIVVVTPTFKNGRVVALFACTTHVVDIGGIGMAPDGKQIYHEGLYIPLMYLFKAGQLNETLIDFVHYNCRESKQVEGDIYALANCNDVGSDRLRAMMVQYKIEDLNELAETIIESTRNAMRAAISKLPITTTTNPMKIDGYDEEIVLKAKLSVVNDTIVIDYEGSSPISDFGINVPKCYTDAYTSFGVKCVVAPEVPNNAGSLAHIIVKAPEGCILATNTSSISITRIAAATGRPGKVIGMHFMNPVPVMKLVEIIRGIATDQPTFDAFNALADRLDKTVAVAEDFPAFIVNRILLPMINEAVYTLYEGVGSVQSIDTALKLGANHPMGPLELADFIGLDTCLAVMHVLYDGLADSKYRPCPLLVKYVEAGWLGRKTGRGFYDYTGDVPVPTR